MLRVNETFVAAIGHDLKSPIHAVALATDLILRSTQEETTRRHAERIKASSRRIGGIIDELFDLARVRLGNGIQLEPADADFATITRHVSAELAGAASGRPIEIAVEGNTCGHWDPGRIEQVVSNILGNAIRHGTPETPIDVRLRGAEAEVVLSVHNAGFIPPELRATLFHPFRGAETDHARRTGLGLGLFIVDQLVRAHHGTIEVESTEAAGTTFRIALPRRA